MAIGSRNAIERHEMGRPVQQDVTNAFHVPLAFLATQTNIANLQAAEHQHMTKAIGPRLQRRDEKLNEQLIPVYDPTRRLFLASEDPTPADPEQTWETLRINLEFGIITINEARDAQGLPPVPWRDGPSPFDSSEHRK